MQQQLKIFLLEITHDKKRFGVMCTLIAFGILLWARLIILQNLPKTGFADPGESNLAASTGPQTGARGDDSSATTEKTADHRAELPITYLDTEIILARNFFARLTIESAQTEGSPSDALFTPKSQTKETEIHNAANLNTRQAIEKAASALRLESVMGGSKPMAVINGDVLGLGETIDGFTLETVATHSVILRRGAFRVELKIN